MTPRRVVQSRAPVRLAAALAALLSALFLATPSPANDAAPPTPPRLIPWKGGATPPLALADLAGQPHSLAQYRGKVVLINFWATWCDPCRDEMPSMQSLARHLAGRPFAILAVNYGESQARAAEFVKRLGFDFQVLLDPDLDAPRAWRVRVLPASFLVDPAGRVRYRVIGEIDWMSREAMEAVTRLMR